MGAGAGGEFPEKPAICAGPAALEPSDGRKIGSVGSGADSSGVWDTFTLLVTEENTSESRLNLAPFHPDPSTRHLTLLNDLKVVAGDCRPLIRGFRNAING